jgi:4-hydroxythreonine-4-phosphate dehydrogenase
MNTTAPLVALTMGDPAGIGPEIVARTFADPRFRDENRAIVIGDAAILERAVKLLELSLRLNEISEPEEAAFEPGTVDVLAETDLPEDLPFGELDARAGDAAFRYVERATQLASAGRVAAVATAPLNKEAMHLAGHKYPGHTEILAELTGTEDYAMMLVTDELKVIHVSTHVSLREAIERVRPDRELAVIRLAHKSLRKLGVERPRVAVAGLNPHAGENGLFGTEDLERIAPAVEEAKEEGIDATGPWPPDTVMMRARRGSFDIVVVQYHDQGHIPVKLMGFDTGVNVTVGLPFFRTSVDHGTAFDIAGSGKADPASLRAALDLARTLAGAEKISEERDRNDRP